MPVIPIILHLTKKNNKKKGLIISDCTQLKFYSKDDVTVPFS